MIRSLPNHLFSVSDVVQNLENAGLDREPIEAIRRYSEALIHNEMPIILDHEWLAQLVGWDTKTIYAIASCQAEFYRTYFIGKRGGSPRKINEPLPTLKDIQSSLLEHICSKLPVHKSSYAYRRGNTIRKNARIHLRQKEILKLDIKEFFGSVRTEEIVGCFYRAGYTAGVSTLIARLCTLNGALAQGAPTSPAISNAVMFEIDDLLLSYFSKKGMRYTRYSDDITISGDKIEDSEIKFVSEILYKRKLHLNGRKTRIFRQGSAKIVTGVQINSKLRAPSVLRDRLRTEIYFIDKYGLPSHARRVSEKPTDCLKRVEGQLNFAIWLDPKDEILLGLKKILAGVRKDYNSLSTQIGF